MPDFLYIHIPFCIRKCLYCDFLSVPYDESIAKDYIAALCRELIMKKEIAGRLKTVYMGGGTPSILPDESFRQLFGCLKDNFEFSDSPEITVEANPGAITESKIYTLLSAGVNRLSIGVQSFNDSELKILGRVHTSEEAYGSIEMVKRAGMSNFSIDLIYGIPVQTIDSWKDTLSMATGFSPVHISSYELTPEEGTPLYELIKTNPSPKSPHPHFSICLTNRQEGGQGGIIKMPDEELILDMYKYAIDHLLSKGYEHYEISNFARPGFRCLHNLNYWERGEYIGAGDGAHSFIKGFRSGNTDDIKKYIEDLKLGVIPEAESVEINCEDLIKEFIFLNLRKTEGISLMKTGELGLDMPGSGRELIEEGYLEVKEDHLKLTRKGIVVLNEIIVRLYEKLGLN